MQQVKVRRCTRSSTLNCFNLTAWLSKLLNKWFFLQPRLCHYTHAEPYTDDNRHMTHPSTPTPMTMARWTGGSKVVLNSKGQSQPGHTMPLTTNGRKVSPADGDVEPAL